MNNIPMPEISNLDQQRFWSKVQHGDEDECWLWKPSISKKNPYGQISIRGKEYLSHRIAYFLTTGVDPRELEICHTCDLPACCNPKHLFLGTHRDNMADMAVKGRNPSRPILTFQQVQEIRNSKDKTVRTMETFNSP
jgi:hypothetical protein